MAKLTLFEAKGGSVVIGGVPVRDGLTKDQAKTLAGRLNHQNQKSVKEMKPTRREQKFSVHVELDFECQSFEDTDEYYKSANELRKEVVEYFADNYSYPEWNGGYADKAINVKAAVSWLYDKQIPND